MGIGVIAALSSGRLDELERVIQRGIGTFVEVGNALREIRDQKLYEPKYGEISFETYCKDRWGFGRRHAYDLITSAVINQHLSTTVHKLPNLEVSRALNPLKDDPEKLRSTWQRVQDEHPGEKITAKLVAEAVRAQVEPIATPTFEPTIESRPMRAVERRAQAAKERRQDDRIDRVLFSIFNATEAIYDLPDMPMDEFVAKYIRQAHSFEEGKMRHAASWLKSLLSELKSVGYFDA